MFSLNRHNPSVIGLDIGQASIKAAQVTLSDKGPRLDGLLCLRRTSKGNALDDSEAARLTRALHRRKMDAPRLVLIAPTDALVSESISVPPASADVSRDKIVENELSRTFSLPVGGFEFSWWDLPPTASGSQTNQAHAVALPHRAVQTTLDLLSEMGLEAVRTMPASLALLAAAQHWPIDPRCITSALDMGAKRAQLVLMHAGLVVHERVLPEFDLEALRNALAEAMDIDTDLARSALGHYGLRTDPSGVVACEATSMLTEALETLTEEVTISYAYVSHLYPKADLGPMLLTGGGANIPGLSGWLSQELEIDAAPMLPTRLLASGCFGSESEDASLAAAIGAALCGGTDHA